MRKEKADNARLATKTVSEVVDHDDTKLDDQV